MKTSKRLAGPAQVSNAAATKYTTPAATRTVITHIRVTNSSGSPATFFCSIGTDAAGTRIADAQSISAGGTLDLYGPYTLEATETIQAYSGTNNVLVLTIDGIEITLG